MSKESILAHRLRRHGLLSPAGGEGEYRELVRRLQPVTPVARDMPGAPPRLMHRCRGDDRELADRLRARQELLKGRFSGGRIAYVLAADFELYAAAFRRPVKALTSLQQRVLEVLGYHDGLSPRQLRLEMGIQHKQLMPVLHRLQEAFRVFEDQSDGGWDRLWYRLDSALPEVDLDRLSWEEAAMAVIRRFLQGHVFATFQELKSWSGFTARGLAAVMARLEEEGVILVQVEGMGEGWTCVEDRDLEPAAVDPGVFLLHRADPLVLPHTAELKERFEGLEVLAYLLIDGELTGAVCGHWRIGPHDVEDIVVTLPEGECMRRKDEIVKEVARFYHPPGHHIRRYAGKALERE
ncbi:MAG: winged helix DNA-binding domain-containing protein [Gemmatimonadaceae bacterium]|nr:winged helix DNA-binding domain-containing protein [Gemmatimonadaceae bacterium]